MKKRTTPPTGRRHSGFTLIEMLIVVAIIAILVAVSIPLVNSSLERARQATDAANERAAKAEAILMFLTEDAKVGTDPFKINTNYAYDAVNGTLLADGASLAGNGYGKCHHLEHQKAYLSLKVDENGVVKLWWSNGDETTPKLHNAEVTNDSAVAGG